MSAAENKLSKVASEHSLGVSFAPEIEKRFRPLLPLVAFGAISALLSPFLSDLIRFALSSSIFSYIILIPFLIGALLYRHRESLYGEPDVIFGPLLLVLCLLVACLTISVGASLSLEALSIVLGWLGAFVLSFGRRAIIRSFFPLFLTIFLIPIPSAVLTETIAFLQLGTAWTTEYLFRVLGIPVLREGVFLSLPTVDIVVDSQCSGIRSSLVLLLADLVLGYLYLRAPWRRIMMILVLVPVAILKNTTRIVILTTLAMYVDPSFLTGQLHHEGGILFFTLGFSMLTGCLWLLRRNERRRMMLRTCAST